MGAVDMITGQHEDDEPLTFPAVKWYKWFAWHPVTVHDKKVWLKTIYRRRQIRMITVTRVSTVWVYGNIFDVLKQ